jgi:hypothetical protein
MCPLSSLPHVVTACKRERERVTGKGKETVIFSRRRWWVCVHMSTVVRKEENPWSAVESTLRSMGPVRLGLGMLVLTLLLTTPFVPKYNDMEGSNFISKYKDLEG